MVGKYEVSSILSPIYLYDILQELETGTRKQSIHRACIFQNGPPTPPPSPIPYVRSCPTPTLKIRRKAETSAETIPTPLEPRFFFLRGLSADESGKRQVLSHRELDNESKFIILIFERIDTAQAETLVLRRERTDVTSEARTALRHSRGSERANNRRSQRKGNRTCGQKGSPLRHGDGLKTPRGAHLLAAISN